jgi:hypothetical protein
MNPDVDRLRTVAAEWDDRATQFVTPPPIGGAAANAATLLSKQILESERRIKSVPRGERRDARDEILRTTVNGYELVRFLFGLGDPVLTGPNTPAATQSNMQRIMSKGAGYSDKEMTQVLLLPGVMAHAVDHAHISAQSGALWSAFGDDARSLRMFAYVTGMRIGLAEHVEFGPT